jgi:hypothetical protein
VRSCTAAPAAGLYRQRDLVNVLQVVPPALGEWVVDSNFTPIVFRGTEGGFRELRRRETRSSKLENRPIAGKQWRGLTPPREPIGTMLPTQPIICPTSPRTRADDGTCLSRGRLRSAMRGSVQHLRRGEGAKVV